MKISKDLVKVALLDALVDGETINTYEHVGDYWVFDLFRELEGQGYDIKPTFSRMVLQIKFTVRQKKSGYKPLNQHGDIQTLALWEAHFEVENKSKN